MSAANRKAFPARVHRLVIRILHPTNCYSLGSDPVYGFHALPIRKVDVMARPLRIEFGDGVNFLYLTFSWLGPLDGATGRDRSLLFPQDA